MCMCECEYVATCSCVCLCVCVFCVRAFVFKPLGGPYRFVYLEERLEVVRWSSRGGDDFIPLDNLRDVLLHGDAVDLAAVRVVLRHNTDLKVRSCQVVVVRAERLLQRLDTAHDGVVQAGGVRLVRLLLHLLLQHLAHLILLLSEGAGDVAEADAVRHHRVQLRHQLVVSRRLVGLHREDDRAAAERPQTRPLRVDLRHLRQTLTHPRGVALVPVRLVELAGLVPGLLHHLGTVGHTAAHGDADLLRNPEEVRDALGLHELVGHLLLADDNGAVLAAQRHVRQLLMREALDRVLDLVQVALRREDGDVVLAPRHSRNRRCNSNEVQIL
eukprot:Rhum_TRINITY_DN7684_c0_g1::Rhum_TRINITY_DN7684_c0_g1_i1::g.24224::m.24224